MIRQRLFKDQVLSDRERKNKAQVGSARGGIQMEGGGRYDGDRDPKRVDYVCLVAGAGSHGARDELDARGFQSMYRSWSALSNCSWSRS